MQGQLGEVLIANLIRDIAKSKGSGLLRVSKGKAIKAIFFEAGAPIFAISNLSSEQFEHRIIRDGLATPQQVEEAKRHCEKANRLGAELVRMGVLTEDVMRKAVCDQIMSIILSLFEWHQGDYVFDERIRAAHDVTIKVTASDIILEGSRHASSIPEIAGLMAPQDGLVVRSKFDAAQQESSKLLPVESYILSRLESPTPVNEIGTLLGIPDEEAYRAVCALTAIGLLKLLGNDKEEGETEDDEFATRLREEVSRKLHFFVSADYYEVLGVTRQATTGDIKAAYYQLAKKFHPDRHRQAEQSDLRGKLEALFARITQAYETLSQPGQRASYDDRLKKHAGSGAATQPLATDFIPPAEAKNSTGTLKQPLSQSISGGAPQQAEAPAPVEAPAQPNNANSTLTAEHYYQQGRARYDRKDYHAAVHLLREAARIDPSKPHYHYHLGVALIRNSRTRHEAEQHLRKAAELDAYNPQIRVKLGILYKEVGLAKKANYYFQEALSLDPDNRIARREIDGDSKKHDTSIWKGDFGAIAKKIFKK